MTKLSPIDTILVDIIRPVLGSRCETHDKEEFPTIKQTSKNDLKVLNQLVNKRRRYELTT